MWHTRFVELLKAADAKPYSYSGRAMYGGRCPAVNIERYAHSGGVIATVMAEANEDEHDDLIEIFRTTREDSMGLGQVIYWPNILWTDEMNKYVGEDEEDIEKCPGCGCGPGDGRTEGCKDPDGCGYWETLHADKTS